MKKIILNFILCLLFLLGCSDREQYSGINDPGVSGFFKEINGSISGELNLSDSPFLVTEDIIVDSGKSLKINPGVEIFFSEGTKLIVKGELNISGSRTYNIFFAAYDKNKKWRGINIIDADKKAKIDFLNIKDVNADSIVNEASILIVNSEADIFHSFFYQNSAYVAGALGILNSTVQIINNVFRDNHAIYYIGAIYADHSDIKIINNTFYNNYGYNRCGGVFIDNPVETNIQNNIFFKNYSWNNLNHFTYVSQDSSTLTEQYNFFAFGNMDPLFFDQDYLTLYYLSPCKDAGNPDPAFNDFNGSRNDQGAYGGPGGNW